MIDLCNRLAEKIKDILEHFEIEFTEHSNRLASACPIHGGQSKDSLVIYHENKGEIKANWKCYSHHCEENWGKSLFGLVHALLNVDKEASKRETFRWCCDFLKFKPQEIESDHHLKQEILRLNAVLNEGYPYKKIVDKSYIAKTLDIPSQYYLNLGYSPEILLRYMIGTCWKPKKVMSYRTVFPVFSTEGYMIGCLGRSLNEECPDCGCYHYKKYDCPPLEKRKWFPKWKNSPKFNTSNYFYNYWRANTEINKVKSALIVEGQGDVLRLEDSKIGNSLGLFGDDITKNQSLLLEKLDCLNVVIATDTDSAGEVARERLTKKLERYYNLFYLDIPAKDFGELSNRQIERDIIPQLRKIYDFR